MAKRTNSRCIWDIHFPTNDQRCDGQWLREQTLAAFGIYTFPQRLQQLLLNSASIAGDRLRRELQPNGER
jgi:hypothetical protein